MNSYGALSSSFIGRDALILFDRPKLRYVMYRAFKQAYDVLQMKERDILRAVHTAITILV